MYPISSCITALYLYNYMVSNGSFHTCSIPFYMNTVQCPCKTEINKCEMIVPRSLKEVPHSNVLNLVWGASLPHSYSTATFSGV